MTDNMDIDLRVSLENNPLVIIASTAANRPTRSTRIKSPGTRSPENHLEQVYLVSHNSKTFKHSFSPRVGADFQADIPNLKEGNENDSDSHPRDLCVWSPDHNSSEEDLSEFIRTAKEEHHLNEEQTLALIALKRFDLKAAKIELSRWCSNSEINLKRSMSLPVNIPAHDQTYLDCDQNGANCVKNVNTYKYQTVVREKEVTFISSSEANLNVSHPEKLSPSKLSEKLSENPAHGQPKRKVRLHKKRKLAAQTHDDSSISLKLPKIDIREALINNPLVIMASTVANRPTRSTRRKSTEPSEVNRGKHMNSPEPSPSEVNRGQGDLFISTVHRECWVNQHGKMIDGKKRKKSTLNDFWGRVSDEEEEFKFDNSILDNLSTPKSSLEEESSIDKVDEFYPIDDMLDDMELDVSSRDLVGEQETKDKTEKKYDDSNDNENQSLKTRCTGF